MGWNIHDVLKTIVSYNTRKWSFFKDKTKNLQGIYTLLNFDTYLIILNLKSCIGKTTSIFNKKLQQFSFKKILSILGFHLKAP